MNETKNALADIVEPAAPQLPQAHDWNWLVLALVAALLVLAAAAAYWWKYRLPAWRAVRRLRQLQQRLHTGEHTPHEGVLLLALELRHGLDVKRLRADSLPQQLRPQDYPRWPLFMQELDALLYQQDNGLQLAQVTAFFGQGEYWLHRYARRSRLRKMDI